MSEGRAKLLDHQPIPVRTDVFLQGLSPLTLEYLQEAKEQGLTPSSIEIADGIAVLRFERPKARLLVERGGTA
jgi:hypothetical protein